METRKDGGILKFQSFITKFDGSLQEVQWWY
jgi:hypothetical protein